MMALILGRLAFFWNGRILKQGLHIAFQYPRIFIRALPFSDDFHYTFFLAFPVTRLAQKIYTAKLSFKYPVSK
jgi:hypothetical protein